MYQLALPISVLDITDLQYAFLIFFGNDSRHDAQTFVFQDMVYKNVLHYVRKKKNIIHTESALRYDWRHQYCFHLILV